jgi:hypothetical protein
MIFDKIVILLRKKEIRTLLNTYISTDVPLNKPLFGGVTPSIAVVNSVIKPKVPHLLMFHIV